MEMIHVLHCIAAKKKSKGVPSPVKSVTVSSRDPDTESDDPSPAEYEDDMEFANRLRGELYCDTIIRETKTCLGPKTRTFTIYLTLMPRE